MSVTFLKSATNPSEFPVSDKPQVALVGRSNVGKSSLLNRLTGAKGLARVSAEPGRTQTINFFNVDKRYMLVDLPGYGYAKTAKAEHDVFAGMIDDYLHETPSLRLVLLIVDARRGLTALDRDMLDFLRAGSIAATIVVNKIDKLSKQETAGLARTLTAASPGVGLIFHSNVTGRGRGEILEAIERAVR